jgi:putative oxidoreductase
MSATSLGLLVLRIVAGGSLAAHGYPKLFGGEGRRPPEALTRIYGPNFPQAVESGGAEKFAKGLESMGVPKPSVAATASGLAEFGGGLALMAGFKTRIAALAVMANMAVAIRKAHWEKGFFGQGGYELAMQFFAAALALFLAGPGALSLDALFGRVGKRGTSAEAVEAPAE